MNYRPVRTMTIASAEATRLGKTDRLVVLQDDNGHESTIILPNEGFTEAKLAAAIKAHDSTGATFLGKLYPAI